MISLLQSAQSGIADRIQKKLDRVGANPIEYSPGLTLSCRARRGETSGE
jgi:hypothetical protein